MMPYASLAHWGEITKPTAFDDKASSWDQFDREWKRYEQLLNTSGMPMPDAIKLEVLKMRVGASSRFLLQRMEEENPHQPFGEFYGALANKYCRDATEQARNVWSKVQIQASP